MGGVTAAALLNALLRRLTRALFPGAHNFGQSKVFHRKIFRGGEALWIWKRLCAPLRSRAGSAPARPISSARFLSGCDCRPLEAGVPLQAGGEEHGEIDRARARHPQVAHRARPRGHRDHAFRPSGVLAGLRPDPVQATAPRCGQRQDASMAPARSQDGHSEGRSRRTPVVGIFLQPLVEYGDLGVTIAADLMIRDSERRCAAALLRLAGRRYANPQDVTSVEVPLTLNELAGAANLSRNVLGGTSSLRCGRDPPTRSGATPAAAGGGPRRKRPGRRRR
jgi:hypothetical protein